MEKKTRGGARVGAGKKPSLEPTRNINISLRVTPEEKELIWRSKGDKGLADYILEKVKEE